MGNNKILGKAGEAIAAEFLVKKGYVILETNYTIKTGEIDIIAWEKEYIVFVEVKYRRSLNTGYPAEAVTVAKQRKIRTVATYYLAAKGKSDTCCRFDVIQLLGMGDDMLIDHIENAF